MKFLVFGDVHEDTKKIAALVKRAKQDDVEFIICVGDISTFGTGLKYVLNKFNKIGKPFYVIPGNHEEKTLHDVIKDYENCHYLHENAQKVGKYIFLGYGGGGFAQEDKQFRKVSREWYGKYNGNKNLILVTHMPPFGCKLDKLEMGHVGSKDYVKFIKRITPKMVLCGHLHENEGVVEKINGITMLNPGREGKVIELP
ncbi:TPA: hypothetical protein HA278_07565 [Candidatus Woesearchaeota archaeon]|nr:hypothetical protein [archaeon]HIJ11888.1 hypothetical protein [Candidatus Woesearchaeota archaeon]